MAQPDTIEHSVESQPVTSGRKLATLVVVGGSPADLGVHARVERRVLIGRDPRAHLPVTDATASRRHAAVEPISGFAGRVRYELTDLGSSGGTLVNGKRVTTARKLKDGDKISIGSTVLRFALSDEVDAEYQARVEAMLSTDELTGLLTHRRFEAALDEALRAAKAKGTCLSLLVLDIDDLKGINDRWGHATGAFTISEVGRLIAKEVGDRGTATRFGGDEFVAFLPGLDGPAALFIANALRDRIARHRFALGRRVVKPTVSTGVAVFPSGASNAKALFEAADRAMYRAKAAGKDRVAE